MSRKLYCKKCGAVTKHNYFGNTIRRIDGIEEELSGIYACEVCAMFRSGPAIK